MLQKTSLLCFAQKPYTFLEEAYFLQNKTDMFKEPTICCHSIQEFERAKNNYIIQDEKLNTKQKQHIQEYTYFTAIQSYTHVHYNNFSRKSQKQGKTGWGDKWSKLPGSDKGESLVDKSEIKKFWLSLSETW